MSINKDLAANDKELGLLMHRELVRQQNTIELIASENIASKAVIEAQGSILTNKYAEGYPGRRYYGGCGIVDKIENLAIERAKQLFNAKYANVQPHSGSQANFAVYLALLQPGDCILGMSLNSGGHLTHGAKVSVSGKWFNIVSYDVNSSTELIDYKELERLALEHKPKLIIAGFSAYSRTLDFEKFRDIANKVRAYLMADIAHVAGLVASNLHPSPLPYCDVVTTTTHKTLRGPRGGLILTNNLEINKKINSSVFPGSQGGPLMHVIAAKATAFKEALQDNFKVYSKNIVDNAKAMVSIFQKNNLRIVSGGTDNHLFLVDLSPLNITGKLVEEMLDSVNITLNKNAIPFDKLPPKETSGIRIGTPAITTRGMGIEDSKLIANLIIKVLKALENNTFNNVKLEIISKVKDLCNKFTIYNDLYL